MPRSLLKFDEPRVACATWRFRYHRARPPTAWPSSSTTGDAVDGARSSFLGVQTAYIDTSALLRLVLREAGALDELQSYDRLVSSELIAVESCRTIDRLRLHGSLTAEEATVRLRAVTEWLEAIDLALLRPISLAVQAFGFDVRGI
jgi:hypothetical protein